MKKMTISMTDEDYKIVEEYRHLFNFSEVFRKAIKEKIAEIEEFKQWKRQKRKNLAR